MVTVPLWAKDAIWYQIFPERFRNGDSKNDPTQDDTKTNIKDWKIKNWGQDWYKMDDWEKAMEGGFYTSVFSRRYGGDLQGIIDKLDYLEELGVTAIYINPVFRAPSLHKYDGSCFHHVDESFGPDPIGDKKLVESANETEDPSTWVWTEADKLLLKLIKEAHKRKMKVIIDGVFNHSGRYFFAFEDVLKNGENSRYAGWYQILRWDKSLEDGFEYKGWFGVHSLPEFKRDENNLNKEYREYLFNITRRWMAPNGKVEDGVDGWRLDVAFCVPHGFWKEWHKVVKGINPEAYMTAEVIEIASDFLQGDEFDSTMNYPFAFCVIEFFADKKDKISVTEFDKKLRELRDSYNGETNYILQNLISSHDSPRLRTLIVNPDMNYREWEKHYERSKLQNNPDYRTDRGTEVDKQTHKLIALFQMTYLGAPMIYYGDEVGMTGANDPDERKPMLWDDIQYEDETLHPIAGKTRPVEKNQPDKELFSFYKKIIKIRKDHPSLRRGDFKTLITDDEKGIYGFQRVYKDEQVMVVINSSDNEQKIFIKPDGKNNEYIDILNEDKVCSLNEGLLNLEIPSRWAVILTEKK